MEKKLVGDPAIRFFFILHRRLRSDRSDLEKGRLRRVARIVGSFSSFLWPPRFGEPMTNVACFGEVSPVRSVLLVSLLALSPLPFVAARRTSLPSSVEPNPANGVGLVVCERQEDVLRFVLKSGGKAESDILIENRSSQTITISKIETSCDCVTVKSPPSEPFFKPGERKAMRIAVNLSKDPKYVGFFGPELRLHADISRQVVLLTCDIEVRE